MLQHFWGSYKFYSFYISKTGDERGADIVERWYTDQLHFVYKTVSSLQPCRWIVVFRQTSHIKLYIRDKSLTVKKVVGRNGDYRGALTNDKVSCGVAHLLWHCRGRLRSWATSPWKQRMAGELGSQGLIARKSCSQEQHPQFCKGNKTDHKMEEPLEVPALSPRDEEG